MQGYRMRDGMDMRSGAGGNAAVVGAGAAEVTGEAAGAVPARGGGVRAGVGMPAVEVGASNPGADGLRLDALSPVERADGEDDASLRRRALAAHREVHRG
jgi:hypothetical protein